MADVFKITSEDDAWAILEAWLNKQELPIVEFDGWPRLNIAIRGAGYQSSLNTRQMSAFLDFKMVMGRAYSSIAHGAYDARRLRGYEEEQLELTTTVKKGSSITETDFTSLVNAFAGVVSNNPQTSLAAAIVLGLLFVSKPLIAKHLDNRSKQLDSAERLKLMSIIGSLTPGEKARVRMMDRAVTKIGRTYPQFSQALPDTTAAHWRLTASAADADEMVVAGLELNKKQLSALSERRAFRKVEIDTLEDDFLVLGMVRVQNSYRIQLKSRATHISATYKTPQMTDASIRLLSECFHNRQLVRAQVELKIIEKSQILGRLMSFEPVVKAGRIDDGE
ncbi:hypothetical protein LJR099_004498 [Variovorax paradoxus]|uniref:hypothetical protein n=1 Tax=Variovorax paradoxus TaxID=34073 RepID=UPI00399AB66C